MRRYLLTTRDNPYHPADEFDKWYKYDLEHGYDTARKVAKFATGSLSFADAEDQRATNWAVLDLLRLDELNQYKLVVVEE